MRTTPGAGAAGALHRAWSRNPRGVIALKGAVAAALAWLAATLAPEPFSEYPYYAPLGAVIATTSTVARSVRESVQAVGALLAGAVVAQGVDLVPVPGVLSVALVVGVALLCSGWRGFGGSGIWVVTSALFVLILGNADAIEYAGAYIGLVLAGAVIGVGVNLLVPPLLLLPTALALDRLRDGLVEQLETVAADLEDGGPDPDVWERRRRDLAPTIEQAREQVAQISGETRVNLQLRRRREQWSWQEERSGVLGTAANAVDSVVRHLVEWEGKAQEEVALGPRLRPATATALRGFAAALRARGEDDDGAHDGAGGGDEPERFAAAVRELRAVVRRARTDTGHDYLVAGAVVVSLDRAADALAASRDG